jgi:hypothetical protein
VKKHLSLLFALILTIAFFLQKETPFYKVNNKPTGDTIEYKASAFVIQPNDKLGDLLQRIPNVEVNKDGVILAQGEAVKMLLVDGEEYFTDAPSVGLNSIRADRVDKIQFYHRITDQGTFTGIDDKVRIKTINVKLKKEK